jgi:hypothetical protein
MAPITVVEEHVDCLDEDLVFVEIRLDARRPRSA